MVVLLSLIIATLIVSGLLFFYAVQRNWGARAVTYSMAAFLGSAAVFIGQLLVFVIVATVDAVSRVML
jgi:hypothetical protein